jgi:hypothetical protein
MENRKLFGLFSGTHLTIITCAAFLVPGALYATVSYTPVGIVNPNTGTLGYVDASGSLHTSDEYGYYRNNPLNYVDLVLATSSGDSCGPDPYTVPSGKALVITSITGNYYNTDGDNSVGFAITTGASCGGNAVIIQFEGSAATAGTIVGRNYVYPSGVPVPAGSVLNIFDYGSAGNTYVHGFLVPASLVSSSSFIDDARSATSRKPGPRGTP